MIYFFVLICILYCIFRYEVYNDDNKGIRAWFKIILFLLVVISGLSYRLGGTDGVTYMNEFNQYSSDISSINVHYLTNFHGRLPGWVFLSTMCKSIVPYYWFFKLTHALIINTIILHSIKCYTKYFFSGVLVYFVLFYFTYNFVILRQSISIALFLFATKYYFGNKWIKYYLVVFFTMLFHDSSFILLFFPLIRFVRINLINIILFAVISIVFIRYSDLINTALTTLYITDDFTNRVNYYAKQIEDNEFGGYINYILNIFVPLVGLTIMKKDAPQYSGFVLSYMLIYIMGLSIPIMYRFGDFLLFFYYVFFVDFFAFIANKITYQQRRIKTAAFIFTLLFVSFRARMYFADTAPGYPKYVWYYPYSSVIFEEKYTDRENCYRMLD